MKYITFLLLSCFIYSAQAQRDSFCPFSSNVDVMVTRKDSCFLNGLFWGKTTTRYYNAMSIRPEYRFVTDKELWIFTDSSIIRSSKGHVKYYKSDRPFVFMDSNDVKVIMYDSGMGTVSLLFSHILNSFTTIVIGFGKKTDDIEIVKELP